jgi:hypothetical protein
MHPGRTDACRSAPVPSAAPPHLTSSLGGTGQRFEFLRHHEQVRPPGPAREASSAHGHVSGGKRQGQVWRLLGLRGGRRAAYSENRHGSYPPARSHGADRS